jgi:hypothetical protein
MKRLALLLPMLAFALVALGGAAEGTAPVKLQYAGYLVDSPVLDARIEVAGATRGPYRMSFSTGLVGSLGNFVPFHMKASSEGSNGEAGPRPASYHSETSIYDNSQSVLLRYSPNGGVTLTDDPPTEQGQEAVARGLLAGTVDPLSAVLGIIATVGETRRCEGKFHIFDGVRRYDVSISPAPEGVGTPRLPAAPHVKAMACDAAVHLLAGFPQAMVDAGMYPTSARFWLASGVVGPDPVLLRVEAESGLGKLRFDLRAVLP